MRKYFGDFEDLADVRCAFGMERRDFPSEDEMLYASYHTPPYEGYAFVLFKQDGKLYEVNGSHCSCHGLSEISYSSGGTQWEPEETSLDALSIRPRDWEGLNDVLDSLKELKG